MRLNRPAYELFAGYARIVGFTLCTTDPAAVMGRGDHESPVRRAYHLDLLGRALIDDPAIVKPISVLRLEIGDDLFLGFTLGQCASILLGLSP